MSVDSLFWLNQIQSYHRDRVGSKAFYLAVLQQRGYPVIPGLVVSSNLLQTFLTQVKWADPTFADLPASSLYVDVDNPRQLQAAAQQIRQAIAATPFPEDWLLSLKQAMQSSSDFGMIEDGQAAGQPAAVILRPSFSLASGLDPIVSSHTRGLFDAKICRPEPEIIAQTLKQVWSELFRARSLLYWQRLGIQPQQVQLAVLVQPIRSAIASGEAIVRGSEVEIRAVWGLGHGMAQGVSADCYQVNAAGEVHIDRVSRKTVAYSIAAGNSAKIMSDHPPKVIEPDDGLQMQGLPHEQQTQPVLTQEAIEHLAHLCRQLTLTLDMTAELEWTFCAAADSAEPGFYITQVIPYSRRTSKSVPALSRPVALPDTPERFEATADSPVEQVATHRLKGIAAAPGTVIGTVWLMPEAAVLQDMPPGCVLVAPMILPEWISQLDRIAGIVTERGGTTSHGAILARELGIPAVVGATDAMHRLKTGDRVRVNGDRGEVIPIVADSMMPDSDAGNPELLDAEPPESLHPGDFSMRTRSFNRADTRRENRSRSMPATATQILVSLSQTESIAQIHEPIDGVGLLRSELLWLQSLDHRSPEHWLQHNRAELIDRLAQQIQPFVERMLPKPVFYRSLDARSHEFPLLAAGAEAETNPMLGLRGSLRYQTHPAWFEVELAALRQVQQAGYGNLRLILPFVRTVEEFRFCRDRVEQAGLRQPLSGSSSGSSSGASSFELWIMAEVPSVLLLLPAYIEAGIQGAAIGCNDLTQLLLGVDRDHPQLTTRFNMSHPAVMEAIRQIIQTCRSAGLPCTICGQLPRQMDAIDRLVEWGVTGISVEPGTLGWVSEAIERAEWRVVVEGRFEQL